MNHIVRKPAPSYPHQQNPQASLLEKCLSDNESEKCLSSKVSCGSAKVFRRTQQPERKAGTQIFYRKSTNEGTNKKILFNSPQRHTAYHKNNILSSVKSSGEVEVPLTEQKQVHECSKEFHKLPINQLKMISSSALDLGSPGKNIQLEKTVNKQCCNCFKQLQYMKHEHESLKTNNKILEIQNKKMKKKVVQLQNTIKKDYILRSDYLGEIEKQRDALKEQKQINRLMEYMIEELNIKIDQLLKQRESSVKILDDSQGSINLCANSSTNQSPFLEHSSITTEKNIDRIGWLEEINERLEHQNNRLKEEMKDALKNIKYHELEAAMTKKLREELILERSLRESYQNRNKTLNNQIKELTKLEKSSKKNVQQYRQSLDDSLTLSVDFD